MLGCNASSWLSEMTPWYLSTKESWKQPVKNSAVLLNHQNMQHASRNPIKSPGPFLTSRLQRNYVTMCMTVPAKDKVSQRTSAPLHVRFTCHNHILSFLALLNLTVWQLGSCKVSNKSDKQRWAAMRHLGWVKWHHGTYQPKESWKQPLDPLRLIVQSLYPIIFPVISLKSIKYHQIKSNHSYSVHWTPYDLWLNHRFC